MSKIKQLEDIVDWRLCLGCGACQYICPEQKISLVNLVEEGIRPQRSDKDCGTCDDCVAVCPSVQSDFVQLFEGRNPSPIEKSWGAIDTIWEGYASDEEIRFKGSSGGALTALSAYCIEQAGMGGVLHIGQDPSDPVLNSTRLSRNREELMQATGSRYSPASVCNRLDLVENSEAPCAVIGKPSEISAVRNAMSIRPGLAAKVSVTMSFFCAETPPTWATLSLLEVFKEDPSKLKTLRYRGHGWPGYFTVSEENGESREHWIYQKSWAYLQKFRPWAVQMWPDGSGELADITCGDPWYEEPDGKNPGFSLIVARTPKGREIIQGAISAGYLEAKIAEPWKLQKSQEGLLAKKGSIWGRRLASRALGIPTTEFTGGGLFQAWKTLPPKRKIASFAGTLRRLLQRKFYHPQKRTTLK
jgi:coenzyme F420 hydrogenase subunit beta